MQRITITALAFFLSSLSFVACMPTISVGDGDSCPCGKEFHCCDDSDRNECVQDGKNCVPEMDDDGVLSTAYTTVCTDGQTEGCNDNCPHIANPNQENSDSDEFGDHCDFTNQNIATYAWDRYGRQTGHGSVSSRAYIVSSLGLRPLGRQRRPV